MQKHHYLGEDAVETAGQTLAAEEVDGTEVRGLHAAQPHVCYILHKEFLHLTAGVHIVQICIDDDLEQHPGVVTACPAALVSRFDVRYVEPVDDGAYNTSLVVLGKIIAKTWRKKQAVVGIIRFKNYLCHCCLAIRLLGC